MLLVVLFGLLTQGFSPSSCGDGVSGPRVQIVYAHGAENDRIADVEFLLRREAARINDVFQGYRAIRFVSDAACTPTIVNLTIISLGSSLPSFGELQSLGLNDPDRKYLVFMDDFSSIGQVGGAATVEFDTNPEQSNRNNIGPSWVVIHKSYWVSNFPALLLLATLGAPGSRTCFNPFDVTCDRSRFFNPNPPPGSYLATHWNIANSKFLDVTEPPPVFKVFIP